MIVCSNKKEEVYRTTGHVVESLTHLSVVSSNSRPGKHCEMNAAISPRQVQK